MLIYVSVLYQIPLGKTARPGNSLGIAAAGRSYVQADLDVFYSKYAPQIPAGTGPQSLGRNGTATKNQGGLETTADLEVSIPIIYPQTTKLYFDGFYGAVGDPWDPSGASRAHRAPNVFSSSYLNVESPGDLVARRLCNDFMKLGMQGVSVVVATGDTGVGGAGSASCKKGTFEPLFPASCPYVTAVGGTMVSPSSLPSISGPDDI